MLAAVPARATEFRTATRTVGQVFDTTRVDGKIVPRQRFTEQLGLRAFDLTNSPKSPLHLVVWMRFDTDFGLAGIARDTYPPGIDRRFNALHLQQASLEGKQLWGAVDVRLGRWMQVDPLGWFDGDGAFARVWLTDALAVHALAALEVKQDGFVLNDAAFDPDGTDPGPKADDDFTDPITVIGAGARWDDRRWFAAEVGYRRHVHLDSGLQVERVERETLAAALEVLPGADVGARALVRYDLFSARLPRTELTLRQRRGALDFAISYQRLVPTFDADSIFNVFDLRANQETSLRIGGTLAHGWRASGRLGGRWYEGAGAEGAISARTSLRWDQHVALSAQLVHHTEVGPGGLRVVTWLEANSRWIANRWKVGARAQHLYFDVSRNTRFAHNTRFARNTRFDGHGVAARLSGQLRAGPFGRAELQLEEAINPYAEHEFRATVLVDLDFLF